MTAVRLDAAPAQHARTAVAELCADVAAQNPDADPVLLRHARAMGEAVTVERLAQLLDALGYALTLSAVPVEQAGG